MSHTRRRPPRSVASNRFPSRLTSKLPVNVKKSVVPSPGSAGSKYRVGYLYDLSRCQRVIRSELLVSTLLSSGRNATCEMEIRGAPIGRGGSPPPPAIARELVELPSNCVASVRAGVCFVDTSPLQPATPASPANRKCRRFITKLRSTNLDRSVRIRNVHLRLHDHSRDCKRRNR